MTDAVTRLVNLALVHLSEDTVESVETTPAPTRIVKIMPHAPQAIDTVLMRYGWLCALEYATLQPDTTVATNWRYPHAYLMPEGGLRFWTVDRLSGWERGVEERPNGGTRAILRAEEGGPVNVSYVKRRRADALDVNVLDAVAFELAARACQPIKGDTALALKLREAAEKAVLAAMGADGQDHKAGEAMVVDRVGTLRASAP